MTSGRGSRHVLGLVLLGAALALGVGLLSSLRLRADLTQGRLFTVSEGTRETLRDLDRDVTLKFYYSRGARDLPGPLKLYATRVEDLLREYDRLGGRRVVLEVHDPRPLSDEEEWAQRYGLRPLNLPIPGADPVYFGVVGISGTREAALPALSPDDEPRLEYELTRMIQEITREAKPVIYLMTGLPLMGGGMPPELAAMYGGPPQEPAWAITEQLKHFYDLRELDMDAAAIPPDARTLVLVHPAEITERTLYAIDQFMLRGGRLLAFVDPLNIMEAQQGGSPFGGMDGGADVSDLNRLTAAWGVTLVPGQIVADLSAATAMRGRDGGVETDPSLLSIGPDHLNREEVVTSDLNFLLLPYAGVFTGEPVAGLQESVLISTSDRAGLIGAMEARFGAASRARIDAGGRPRRLAIRLQGRFPSAFPDGPPETDADDGEGDNETDPAATAPGGHLREAEHSAAAVLVADTDLLHDAFCIREQSFLGQRVVSLVSDNFSFVLNLLDQLTGSEALIGLRSRGEFRRPFTVVQRIEERAQAAYREEMEALQARERETRQRLQEMQRKTDPDQRVFVTPEQEEAIRQYREELFQTERRIRDLSRELMRDVDRLGLWVKGVNIALMPALVAVFGVVYGVRRRRR